jgi:hypothetical protein
MLSRLSLSFMTAATFALATVAFPAFASEPGSRATVTTEFSAQAVDPKLKKQNVAPRQAPARVVQPRVVQPRVVQPRVVQQPRMEHRGPPPGSGPRNIETRRNLGPQRNLNVQKNIGVQKTINTQNKLAPAGGGPRTAHRTFTPRGASSRIVSAARIRSAPPRGGAFRTSIRGRNYSVWRSGFRVRRGGGWRTFVGLSTLGALAIGSAEYYPYAYIDAPAEYCDGLTEDGCQMVYDDVETMEGDVVPQCVAYCPWQQ